MRELLGKTMFLKKAPRTQIQHAFYVLDFELVTIVDVNQQLD
jgi:hypothetical protein